MKKEIHSENYRHVVFRDTSNGEEFLTRSCAATKETTTYDGEEYPPSSAVLRYWQSPSDEAQC